MKWSRKLTALLLTVAAILTVSTGCSFGGDNTATPAETSSVVTQAPDAPQNVTASVNKKTVTLNWDAVPNASGYVVSLYNSATKTYQNLDTITTSTFTYDGTDSKESELKFGISAFVDAGSHKLYSATIAKVSAVIIQEKVTLNRNKLSVQIGKTGTIKATVNSDATFSWSSADETIATVDSDGVVTGVSEGKTTITATTSNGTSKSCTVTVEEKVTVPDGKLIAITFDDGPSASYTPKLLDALKDRDAKVTFFMLGENVGYNPDLVKRMKAEGHELGNHSYSHADLTSLSKSGIQKEVNKTKEAIYDACGAYPTVFRAPYGNLNDDVLSALDTPSIYWSVDTLDWKHPNVKYVKNQILKNAYDGAIILLHDIHETSVDGFLAALDQLEDEGYTLVTVSQLLSRNGNTPQVGTTYFDMEPES